MLTRRFLCTFVPEMRNRTKLKFNFSYANKLSFGGVHDTVKFNRHAVKRHATIADDAFEKIKGECLANIYLFGQEERKKMIKPMLDENEKMWKSEDEDNLVEPETEPFSKELILIIAEY